MEKGNSERPKPKSMSREIARHAHTKDSLSHNPSSSSTSRSSPSELSSRGIHSSTMVQLRSEGQRCHDSNIHNLFDLGGDRISTNSDTATSPTRFLDELVVANYKLSEHTKKLEHDFQELQTDVVRINENRRQLQVQLQISEKDKSELETQINVLREEITQHIQKTSKLKVNSDKLESSEARLRADLNAAQEYVKSVEERATSAEQRITSLEREVEAKNKNVHELKAEILKSEVKIGTMKNEVQRLKSVESKFAKLKIENSSRMRYMTDRASQTFIFEKNRNSSDGLKRSKFIGTTRESSASSLSRSRRVNHKSEFSTLGVPEDVPNLSKLGHAVATHLVKSGILNSSAINDHLSFDVPRPPVAIHAPEPPGLMMSQLAAHASTGEGNLPENGDAKDEEASDFAAEFVEAIQSDLKAMTSSFGGKALIDSLHNSSNPNTFSTQPQARSSLKENSIIGTDIRVNSEKNKTGDRKKLEQAIQLLNAQQMVDEKLQQENAVLRAHVEAFQKSLSSGIKEASVDADRSSSDLKPASQRTETNIGHAKGSRSTDHNLSSEKVKPNGRGSRRALRRQKTDISGTNGSTRRDSPRHYLSPEKLFGRRRRDSHQHSEFRNSGKNSVSSYSNASSDRSRSNSFSSPERSGLIRHRMNDSYISSSSRSSGTASYSGSSSESHSPSGTRSIASVSEADAMEMLRRFDSEFARVMQSSTERHRNQEVKREEVAVERTQSHQNMARNRRRRFEKSQSFKKSPNFQRGMANNLRAGAHGKMAKRLPKKLNQKPQKASQRATIRVYAPRRTQQPLKKKTTGKRSMAKGFGSGNATGRL